MKINYLFARQRASQSELQLIEEILRVRIFFRRWLQEIRLWLRNAFSRSSIGKPDAHLVDVDLQAVGDDSSLFQRWIRQLLEDSMQDELLHRCVTMSNGH